MRNTIEDKEKLANKIDSDDKKTIKDALKEHQEWLDSNPEADKEDFEEHLKDLQGVCDPIIAKVYKASGGPSGSTAEEDDNDDSHDEL